MSRSALSAIILMVASFGHAAVEVHATADFPGAIQKLAVAPLPCIEGVGCAKVEKALNKSVKKRLPGVTVVTTEQINQALFDHSIVEADKESVVAVARELGCDAILLPAILGSDRKDHWNTWTDYNTGESHVSDAASVASTVQILIITPDGTLLIKEQASGESYLQTDQTYFAESQFDKIMRKATK